ncbi:hypothetical protein C3L33_20875, partial [Rhododendron williamsianum]
MSAMVDVWMGELGKLGEKVRARKPFLLRRRKDGHEDQENEASLAKKKDPAAAASVLRNSAAAEKKKDNTISEATVCLLMDRFAPWNFSTVINFVCLPLKYSNIITIHSSEVIQEIVKKRNLPRRYKKTTRVG